MFDETPSSVSARHEEILRRHLRGEKNVDIARSLNITPQSVYYVIHSPAFQERLAEMKQKIDSNFIDKMSSPLIESRKILEENSEVAAKNLVSLLGSENEKISLSASRDILDRVGVGSRQQHEASITLQVEQTNNLLVALKESGGDPNALTQSQRRTDGVHEELGSARSLLPGQGSSSA